MTMTIRRYPVFIVLLLALGGLTGCGSIPSLPVDPEAAFKLVSSLLPLQTTPTLGVTQEIDLPTPTPVHTPGGVSKEQTIPADGLCNLASPGIPIDITIPDGTRLRPGQSFTKTWRLVNAGTCPWTEDYAVVWFSGEPMGVNKVQYLRDVVKPGQAVDIAVEMIAPSKPGAVQSNWKLRDPDGALFGIGPTGESPFWVRIEIIGEVSTPTPAPTPTVTVTPVVIVEGETILRLNEHFDLDLGFLLSALDGSEDLTLNKINQSELGLIPLQGTRLGLFGIRQPSLRECSNLKQDLDPINLTNINEGDYFCFRSTQGLTGFIRLTLIHLEQNFIRFKFTTWAVP